MVGGEDIGPTLAERRAQGIETVDIDLRVEKLLSEHTAAVPVDVSAQALEALQHRLIGDASAPDLVDVDDSQIVQENEIGIVHKD